MTTRRTKAFSLAEVIVSVMFLGLLLAPLLLFVQQMPDLSSAVGQQGRREAWRSFGDQALVAGVDPTQASALAAGTNALLPAVPLPAVTRRVPVTVGGKASLSALLAPKEETTPEERMGGGGFELGAGASVANRSTPTSPLLPLVMAPPTVFPAPGSSLAIGDLSNNTPGEPYTRLVQSSSTESQALVRLTLARPGTSHSGVGATGGTVSAVDLALGASGKSWAEYQGSGSDRSMTLGDGRVRWFVRAADGRLQIYEPSSVVTFAYTYNLGPLELRYAGGSYSSGTALDIDYTQYRALQASTSAMKIDYPDDAKAAFGSQWGALNVGWTWTFQGAAGPYSGAVTGLFTDDNLPLWSDTAAIMAMSVLPAGTEPRSGAWTLNRVKTKLGKPELSDSQEVFTPGSIEFRAPTQADGSRPGRMSFRGGASVSTTGTITLTVLP